MFGARTFPVEIVRVLSGETALDPGAQFRGAMAGVHPPDAAQRRARSRRIVELRRGYAAVLREHRQIAAAPAPDLEYGAAAIAIPKAAIQDRSQNPVPSREPPVLLLRFGG